MTINSLALEIFPERLIELEGVGNFRDLGGYKTQCGKTVSTGKLFRSASLYKASDADVNRIANELGVRHIIDLRKQRELDLEPHPESLLDQVTYHWLPIELDGTARDDIDRRIEEGTAASAFEGLLIDVNKAMVSQHQKDIQRWFHILLDHEEPILFHCTEGKDRTGFTAAVFLSALGVDYDQVLADYLLTNLVHKYSIEERIKRSAVLSSFEVDVKDLERLLSVDKDYIDAAFEQIDKDFGSVEAYLENALEIDSAKLQSLKDKFLV